MAATNPSLYNNMRIEQQVAKLREYDEEVEIAEDTKLYQEKNLMSGELGLLCKGTKVNCKDFDKPVQKHNLSIKNSLASLMSSTQSTTGGFN